MNEAQTANTFLVALASASLLTVALIWLFHGWRFYWLFSTLLTAVAAAIVGWYFISPHLSIGTRYLPVMLMGLGGGALAIPLQRVVAFLTTGALGAVIAVAVAVGFCSVPMELASPQLVAISAAGFLTAGIPAALFFKFITVLITSGYGALMAIAAVCAIAVIFVDLPGAPTATTVAAGLALWAVLTGMGVLFQWRSLIVHRVQTSS